MRNLFLFILIVCSTINISAQDIVKVFFKSQSEIKNDSNNINSETNNDSIPYIIVDQSGTIINRLPPVMKIDTTYLQSLKQHIFIIRQEYCLFDKKKKKLYGYNDNEQFGMTFSLGIKCKGFNLISDEAVHPWKYDPNYYDFKSDKLDPIITNTRYVLPDDLGIFSYTGSDSITNAVQTIKDNYLYTTKPFTSLQNGIDINVADTCKNGILVWVINKTGDLRSGDIKIDFEFVPTRVEMFGSIAVTPPHRDAEILGCLLVTKNGDSDPTYHLSGIAAYREETWNLYYPFKGFKTSLQKDSSVVKGRLTEIKAIHK